MEPSTETTPTEDVPMHIPKPVLLGLGILAAVFFGWMLGGSSATATPAAPRVAVPVSMQYPASSPAPAEQPSVYVTVVTPGTAAPAVPSSDTMLPPRLTEVVSTPSPSAPIWNEFTLTALADAAEPDVVDADPTGIEGPDQVNGISIIANGDGVVIANDGAIISVGDNTVVHGNTGDANSSGTIGIDVNDSELTSGDSSVAPTTDPAATDAPATTTTTAPAPTDAAASQSAATATTDPAADATGTRAVALEGLELRSIEVGGNDNLLVYDESTLFFHRIGTLNGNTGDTDTSGLNVVDATRSSVRSGSSAVWAEQIAPAPAPVVVTPAASGTATVADGNGIATASGDDTLVIGGDGVEDRRVRMLGDRNVVSYDDAQAAIGGAGDVNAQVGDSANGGTVVMKVVDSNIQAGDALAGSSAT
jgi:hypothetical protein